jgi:hypothetical protein
MEGPMQYQADQFLVLAFVLGVEGVWEVIAQWGQAVAGIIVAILGLAQIRKIWAETRYVHLGATKTQLEILDLQRKLETAGACARPSLHETSARSEKNLRPLLPWRDACVYAFALLCLLVLFWTPAGTDDVVAVRWHLFYAVQIIVLALLFTLRVGLRAIWYVSTGDFESLSQGQYMLCEHLRELTVILDKLITKDNTEDERQGDCTISQGPKRTCCR